MKNPIRDLINVVLYGKPKADGKLTQEELKAYAKAAQKHLDAFDGKPNCDICSDRGSYFIPGQPGDPGFTQPCKCTARVS